ncbi:hypothetical protein EYF80_002645 [Liparis tanakae]|uniref:Uncharacterized protein n=1 Tax=Liparis tanakae TaxID=230148 RepID=A0A4Z2J9W0_9TELE|nr:hypothetical protein EYF80_002645 [Liparis tanakae]
MRRAASDAEDCELTTSITFCTANNSFSRLELGVSVFTSGEQQDFLQRPPQWDPLLRLAVWDHISAPLCAQLDARPHRSDRLQARLSDVPAEVHRDLLQTLSVSHRALQAAVGDADAVLQVEAAQLPAALQHGGHIPVRDVCTARQGQPEQVGTPVAQTAVSYIINR